MGTTKDDLRQWFKEGVKQGATHMIVVCDTFDYEDYPVFVMPGEDAREKRNEYNHKSMQKIMEVYDLAQDCDAQLGEHRAMNL